DLHQGPIRFLLVTIDPREHLRARLVPLGGGQFVPTEEFVQRLGVNIERRVKPYMARYRLKNEISYVNRFIPVSIKPLLELLDFTRAWDLNVKFNVLCQARHREIARTNQRLRADDIKPCVCNIRLGVKFITFIDPTLDLPG